MNRVEQVSRLSVVIRVSCQVNGASVVPYNAHLEEYKAPLSSSKKLFGFQRNLVSHCPQPTMSLVYHCPQPTMSLVYHCPKPTMTLVYHCPKPLHSE